MELRGFSVSEALRFGWSMTKKRFWFFAGFLIVAVLLQLIIPKIVALAFFLPFHSNISASSAQSIAQVIISTLIGIGWVKVSLSTYDTGKAEFKDMFTGYALIIPYFIANILYSFILTAGLILLIIPMFIWGVKFCLFPYYIVDKGLGPINALKQSSKATYGFKWDLFALAIVSLLINLLGVICLVVGLLFTIPLTILAFTFAYRKLASNLEQESPLTPEVLP